MLFSQNQRRSESYVELRPTNRGCVHITWKCLAQPSPTLGRQRAAAERRAPVGGPRGAKPAPPPLLKGSGGTFGPIHADVKRGRKKIFEACVLSKLLYCLHTAWLNKAELRRLNAFQSKCFRKIPNIPHSYVSRISNKTVLEPSGRQEISKILTYRQLILFGKIAALPFTDVRRQCVFSGHTLRPRIVEQPQRRGRPKNSWGPKVYKLATDVVGGADLDEALFSNLKQWKIMARPFCFAQRQ